MINPLKLIIILILALAGHHQQAYAQEPEAVYISQAELDQLLAPIALYPDTVLSHILIASTYPLEVIQAERWAKENPQLKGERALTAVENKDWDPSVKALAPFPMVLSTMSEDLQWTQTLGDAFLEDEERVLSSIQLLRQKANDNGSLSDLDHLDIIEDNQEIIIESRVKEVVYIPYYDTRIVYGPWWWHAHPPVFWAGYHSGFSFSWSPRIHIGTSIYFSSFRWNQRHLVVIDRKRYRNNRFYSGRHVARYANARHWVHNTKHRRGVKYRSSNVRKRYISHSQNSRYSENLRHSQKKYNNRKIKNYERAHRTAREVNERLKTRTTDKRANPKQTKNRLTTRNSPEKNVHRNGDRTTIKMQRSAGSNGDRYNTRTTQKSNGRDSIYQRQKTQKQEQRVDNNQKIRKSDREISTNRYSNTRSVNQSKIRQHAKVRPSSSRMLRSQASTQSRREYKKSQR